MKDTLIIILVVGLIAIAFKPAPKQVTATPVTIIPSQQAIADAFVKQHPELIRQAVQQAQQQQQERKTTLTVHAAVIRHKAETPPLVDATNNDPKGDLVAFQYERMKGAYTSCGGGFECWEKAMKANGHGWQHTQAVKETIKYVATKNKLDPHLALAISKNESGFGHFGADKTVKKSPANAYGVMQLIPPTAKALGVNEKNPFQNIKGGVMYLKQGMKMHKGNVAATVAGYNAGQGKVKQLKRIPRFRETQNYTAQVMYDYYAFKFGGEV